jgi:hypothetical protein
VVGGTPSSGSAAFFVPGDPGRRPVRASAPSREQFFAAKNFKGIKKGPNDEQSL